MEKGVWAILEAFACLEISRERKVQAYFDDAKDSSQESRFKQVLRIKESFNQESTFK